MKEPPDQISNEESFGRGIFDSNKAKTSRNGKVPPRVFMEKQGRELSVDRLSFGADDYLSKLHSTERSGQDFHGWAEVSYAAACAMNRTIAAAKLSNNPFHANILLPPIAPGEDEADDRRQHSVNLANRARWRRKATP
jgi:hypothetical protein